MIDLHTHTTASDGTLTPSQLIDMAIDKGLTAIAITDHDTIVGLAEAIEYIEQNKLPIRLINGIEFSTNLPGYDADIHILGFNIDLNNPVFSSGLENILNERLKRNSKMYSLLQNLGYDIDETSLRKKFDESIITRAHMASYLVSKGYFKDSNQVFTELLGNGMPGHVRRENANTMDAIDLIKNSGGISALAHPTLYNLSNGEITRLVMKLKENGLNAIETYYSLYDPAQHASMRRIASECGLAEVGGSDYHGDNKPNLELGNGYGSLYVPDRLMAIFT